MSDNPNWLLCKSIEGHCKAFPAHLCAFAIPDLAVSRCSDPAMKSVLEKSVVVIFGQIELICSPNEVTTTTDHKEVINFLSNKALPQE
jgi:hypothetical protein